MANLRISLCWHGPKHRNGDCGYAHSFADLEHPAWKRCGYPQAFWNESVSMYYGQNLSGEQRNLLAKYCWERESEDIVPDWVKEALEGPGITLSGSSRDIFALQRELCELHEVYHVAELFHVEPRYAGMAPWKRQRVAPNVSLVSRSSRTQESSLEKFPMVQAYLGMLLSGAVVRQSIDERFKNAIPKKHCMSEWDCAYSELSSLGKCMLHELFPELSYSEFECWVRDECCFPKFRVSLGKEEGRPLFHGTSFGNLFGIMGHRRRAINAGEDGYIYVFRTAGLVAEKQYAMFQYIGNGVLVRCTCMLHGNFKVKKGTSGPQLYAESAVVNGFIMELVSPRILQELPEVWQFSYAC